LVELGRGSKADKRYRKQKLGRMAEILMIIGFMVFGFAVLVVNALYCWNEATEILRKRHTDE